MKIAINGFGRIGRIFFRQVYPAAGGAFDAPDFDPVRNTVLQTSSKLNFEKGLNGEVSNGVEIVALNDLGDLENMAYLLKYDTVYGRYNKIIKHSASDNGQKELLVDDKKVAVFQEKDPVKLPWKDLGIDIVVESTGVFDSYEKAKAHLEAGAKRVVITAPAKDNDTPTSTPNVGVEFLSLSKITSNASCTTNAATPVAAIMFQNPGIKKAILNTVHGYTATQGLVDSPVKKDWNRGRAAAVNIVPSHTGAAIAAEKAIPALRGKFDGVAMRVPVISGSLIDFTFLAERKTSVEEINNIFKEAAEKPEWKGILKVTEEPIVSTDILGEPYGSIVDLNFTRVVDGDLVKIFSWYDNEWGYCAMLLKHIDSLKNLL